MGNVQFDDQQQYRSVSGPKGLEGMMIKWGLAKDRKGAQMVLLIIGAIAVAVWLYFAFFHGGPGTATPPNTPLPDGSVPLPE